jgi:hypothetical protein
VGDFPSLERLAFKNRTESFEFSIEVPFILGIFAQLFYNYFIKDIERIYLNKRF